MNVSRSAIGRSLALTFAGQIIMYLQGLIIMPIAIHLAGEMTYGSYVLVGNLLILTIGISGLGAGYRYRRQLPSSEGYIERRRLFEPQFTFQVLSLSLVSGAIILAGDRIQVLLFGPTGQVANVVLIGWLGTYLVYAQVTDYFRYTLRFVAFNAGVGVFPGLFVLGVASYAWYQRQISVEVLLLFQILAYAIAVLPLLVIMLREIGLPKPRLPLRELASDIAIGSPLTGQFLIDFLMSSSDRYLIAFFLSVGDVGRYQPAYQLAALITFFPKVAGAVLPPTLSRMVDMDNKAEAHRLVVLFLRLFLMLAIPFAVGAAMVGPSIIALLTNMELAYASRWVCPCVAIACLFYGITLVAFQAAYVVRRTRVILWANMLGAGISLALNTLLLWLIPDITIPAFVAIISYSVSCLYVISALRPAWPIEFEARRVLCFAGAATVMAGVLSLCGFQPGIVINVTLVTLLEVVVLAIGSYFLMLHFLGGFGRSEWNQLRAIFRRDMPAIRHIF